MKKIRIILITTISVITGIYSLFALENEFFDAARHIMDISQKHNIKNLVVGNFESKNYISSSEMEYIRDKTIEALTKKSYNISISEFKGSGYDKDAVIYGNVYVKDEGFEIIFKLIRVQDSKILGIISKKIEEPGVMFSEDKDMKFVTDIDFNSLKKLAKEVSILPEMRDSISDYSEDCSEGIKWINNMQRETIDQRARYWAWKMNQDNFSLKSLSFNPGSEIKDEELKSKFYELLKKYYYDKVKIESTERKYIEQVYEKEKLIDSKCRTIAKGWL